VFVESLLGVADWMAMTTTMLMLMMATNMTNTKIMVMTL